MMSNLAWWHLSSRQIYCINLVGSYTGGRPRTLLETLVTLQEGGGGGERDVPAKPMFGGRFTI